MKPASISLINLLNHSSCFLMADLYTVTLRSGAIFRWANSDTDLVFDGHTFTAAVDQGTSQPLTRRGSIRTVAGLEVDTMDLTLPAADTVQLLGVPLPPAPCSCVGFGRGCRKV